MRWGRRRSGGESEFEVEFEVRLETQLEFHNKLDLNSTTNSNWAKNPN